MGEEDTFRRNQEQKRRGKSPNSTVTRDENQPKFRIKKSSLSLWGTAMEEGPSRRQMVSSKTRNIFFKYYNINIFWMNNVFIT